jgi:site-specific DNA-cytosine methylase
VCNLAEAFAAGNAVVPAIARWIAEKLLASDEGQNGAT